MKGKFFKENILNTPARQFKEIGSLVNSSGTALIKFFSINNIFTIGAFLNIISVLIIFFSKNILPEKVPFFYSRPWGTEQIGKTDNLFLIPLACLVFGAISYTLSKLLQKTEIFLSIMSGSFFLLSSVMGIITIINIIFLVV